MRERAGGPVAAPRFICWPSNFHRQPMQKCASKIRFSDVGILNETIYRCGMFSIPVSENSVLEAGIFLVSSKIFCILIFCTEMDEKN